MSKRSLIKRTLVTLPLVGLSWLIPALAHAGGPYSFYSVTPCRLVDTRDPALQGGAVIPRFTTVTFTAKGRCGVPADAQAVSLNTTVIVPTGSGFLTLYPTGVTRPWVSVINWALTDVALSNGAVIALGTAASGELSAYHETDGDGTIHLILDVYGYFK